MPKNLSFDRQRQKAGTQRDAKIASILMGKFKSRVVVVVVLDAVDDVFLLLPLLNRIGIVSMSLARKLLLSSSLLPLGYGSLSRRRERERDDD